MMTDDQNNQEPDTPQADAAAGAQDAGGDPVERLRAENADLKDRFLRAAAEMENLRRRTARDVRDAKSYAIAGFARDMLQVSDNLRRALESVASHVAGGDDSDFKTLIEGVELTERSMLATFERHGVRKIDPKGEKFDPNFHQAMFEVPNPELPNNTVFEVVQPGYVIGERMLRPAMVGVARGGPKDAAAEPAATAPEGAKDA